STAESRQKAAQQRIDLFRDLEAALGENPAGKKAGALAARWHELGESDSGGHADVKAGWERAWADRRNWPDDLRRKLASALERRPEAFDRTADFLEKIRVSHKE